MVGGLVGDFADGGADAPVGEGFFRAAGWLERGHLLVWKNWADQLTMMLPLTPDDRLLTAAAK